MTTTFYAPPSSIRGSQVVLPDDEAHHAARALRKEAGDEIVVVDGEGGWYRVRLHHVQRQQVVGHVVNTRSEVGEPSVHVTIGMALLKTRSRFETFVEKAVELGVRQIVPLRTARTERESLRADRLRNVMIAAMKQCGRSRLPALAAPQSPVDALDDTTTWFICHETVDPTTSLWRILPETPTAQRLGLLVGPEGGFTEDEVDRLRADGGTPISLGARRLRAETAGIVAATTALAMGTETSV
jgi:16S rRNA (uracil1498-N3)-methyltransferase